MEFFERPPETYTNGIARFMQESSGVVGLGWAFIQWVPLGALTGLTIVNFSTFTKAIIVEQTGPELLEGQSCSEAIPGGDRKVSRKFTKASISWSQMG